MTEAADSVETDCTIAVPISSLLATVSVLVIAAMSGLTVAIATAEAEVAATVAAAAAFVVIVGVTVAAIEAIDAVSVLSSVVTAAADAASVSAAAAAVVSIVAVVEVVEDEMPVLESVLAITDDAAVPSAPPPQAARKNAAGMRVARVLRQKGARIWFMTSVKIQSRGRLGMLAAVPPPEGGGAEKRARWRFALPAPFEGTFGWADALKCTDEFRSLGV